MTRRDDLLDLLPQVLLTRDAEQGGTVAELLGILAAQVEVLDEALDTYRDDLFIETCSDWVVPYLGDLIGYRPVHGRAAAVRSSRAEVANTIAYRRRKGTAAMLADLATAVTDWPAHVVECFEQLVTHQYLNHVRPHALGTVDLRTPDLRERVVAHAGAFDPAGHLADVRRIAAPRPATAGRWGIPNVALFLWRLEPQRLGPTPLVPAVAGDRQRFRIDQLGTDTPLFAHPDLDAADPLDRVPRPLSIRRTAQPGQRAQHYGPGRSIALELVTGSDREAVARADVEICDLADDLATPGQWAHPPDAGSVAIDPERGRVWFGTAVPDGTTACSTAHQGLAVPAGARTWRRRPLEEVLADVPGEPFAEGAPTPVVEVSGDDPLVIPTGGTLRLGGSSRWDLGTVTATDPLVVTADERERPVLTAGGAVELRIDPGGVVVLDGLLVTGGPLVVPESGDREPRTLVLSACTLVPGHGRTTHGKPQHPERASLLVLDPFATVVLLDCVSGPVVAVAGSSLTARDSIVDAGAAAAVAVAGRAPVPGGRRTASLVADQVVGDGLVPAGAVELERCTVVGGVHADTLSASDSLLVAALAPGDPRPAAVWVRRRQVGCVRFSWLPLASRTGRRFRCVPDAARAATLAPGTGPEFTSRRFGHPGYLQLSAGTPDLVRRGASDEGEMGATHDLYAPQREDDLAVRLEEYLRFGLEAGTARAT